MEINFYTDGSSRGNPGPGGWGVFLEIKKNNLSSLNKRDEAAAERRPLDSVSEITVGEKNKKYLKNIDNKLEVEEKKSEVEIIFNKFNSTKLSGGVKLTTNNKMELQAGIEALKFFKNNFDDFLEISGIQSTGNDLDLYNSEFGVFLGDREEAAAERRPLVDFVDVKLATDQLFENHLAQPDLGSEKSLTYTKEKNNSIFLKDILQVTIKTDSQYMKNGIESWIINWQKNNWRGSNKKAVLNQEYWQELLELKNFLNQTLLANNFPEIKFEYVKAHAGILNNEIADQLATAAADKYVL